MTKKKKIFIILCASVLFTVLTVLGVLTALGSFTEYKSTVMSSLSDALLPKSDNGTDMLKIYNSDYMKLTSEVVTVTDGYVDTKCISLKATVLPDDATDKSVDWSVEFVNPSSDWASGKNAADYVSAIPDTDGANEVLVYAILPFSEEIKIVATSRSSSTVSAYAVAGYGQRLSNTLNISFDNVCISDTSLKADGTIQTVKAIMAVDAATISSLYTDKMHCNLTFLPEYTASSTVSDMVVMVKADYSFYRQLQEENLSKSSNEWVEISFDGPISQLYDALCNGNGIIPIDGSTESYERANAFNRAIAALDGSDYDFEIKITVSTDYEFKDYIIQCRFDRTNLEIAASDVNMSQTDFIL